jgi:hypothetical protein
MVQVLRGRGRCISLSAILLSWSPDLLCTRLALRRKHMAHDHGDEYQVRVVHQDGTEELSGWMNSEEQVAQAVAAVHNPTGKAFWLRVRSILCANCPEREQGIVVECPLTGLPSPRCSPHDSYYLLRVGVKNRNAVSNQHFHL